MTITKIDRIICKQLVSDIEIALQKVADKHGLAVKVTGGRFTDTTFSPKMEFATKAEDGTVRDTNSEDFKKYAEMFGLKAEDLGRKFKHMGRDYRITGLSPDSHKNPIICTRADGRVFKFSTQAMKFALAASV